MNETKQAEAMMKAIALAGYNAGYRKGCRDTILGMLIGAGIVTATIVVTILRDEGFFKKKESETES